MTMPVTSQNSDSISPSDSINATKQTTLNTTQLESWCIQQYTRCRENRRTTERQWYLNMAFYFGRQNVQLLTTSSATTTGFILQTPAAPPWRVRLVTNKIRRLVRQDIERLMSQKPTMSVMPSNTDEQEISAARIGEDIVESMYYSKKLESVYRSALFWAKICGNSFIKTYWDPNAVDMLNNQKGDVAIERINPFFLLVPDLTKEEIEQQPFIIHAATQSNEWVANTFGKDFADSIVGTGIAQVSDLFQESFLTLVGATATPKDAVLVLEFWIKPGTMRSLPKGGLVTLVGNKIVQVHQSWPYDHNEYPFSKLEDMPSGKFYSDSQIVDQIPLQREYNRTRSQIIEAKNRMAKPQLIAPRGSINPAQIVAEPGQVILYTPGLNPPTALAMQPLPTYVLEELKTIQADMLDLSGQADFLGHGSGGPPPDNATAMAFMQEILDSSLGHAVSKIEASYEKTGRQILALVSQYWNTGRLIKIVGADGSFDAQVFKSDDLNNNYDLRVDTGSAMPASKAGRQAFIMDLVKLGVLPPDKALEALDIVGITKVMNELQIDMKQARRENMRMMGGEEVPVNSWDNHQLHIQYHNMFRKTQQFESLDAETKTLFEDHVNMHMHPDVPGTVANMAGQPGAPGQTPGQPGAPVGPPGNPPPPGQPADPSQSPGQPMGAPVGLQSPGLPVGPPDGQPQIGGQ